MTIRASAPPVLRPLAARLRRFAWILAAASSAQGCGAAPHPPVVGDDGWGPSLRDDFHQPATVDAAPPAPRARPIPEAQRAPWPRAEAVASWPEVGGRGPSEHLDGRHERTVVADPSAAEAYAHLTVSSTMAAGAVVLQRHHPPASPEIVSYFGMEKLAAGSAPAVGDWRFFVLDEELRLAADEVSLCGRCHGEAPFHGLFGPPPDAPTR